jgi:hypothetical protein
MNYEIAQYIIHYFHPLAVQFLPSDLLFSGSRTAVTFIKVFYLPTDAQKICFKRILKLIFNP